MLEFIENLRKKKEPKSVLGLSYRPMSGVVKENPPRPLIIDLDMLSMSAYHLFHVKIYFLRFLFLQLWLLVGDARFNACFALLQKYVERNGGEKC